MPDRPDVPDVPPATLARERTDLAWSRTAIAFAALGGAILKKNVTAGLIVLALSGLIWVLHWVFPDPGTGATADAARPRQLLVVTVTVATVALIALILAFVGS